MKPTILYPQQAPWSHDHPLRSKKAKSQEQKEEGHAKDRVRKQRLEGDEAREVDGDRALRSYFYSLEKVVESSEQSNII